MAFSAQRLLHNLQTLLAQCPCKHTSSRTIWLAYSGGLDSHVLLHAIVQVRGELTDWQLQAIHIDHALQQDSSNWSEHCRSTCEHYAVPCTVETVTVSQAGESPEAAARDARYAALAEHLQEGDVLLTAQHADDQAETFMLQMLRGSGPKGLAAMPAARPFSAGYQLRPLLEFSRRDLQAYAEEHALQFIHDPSNDDRRFDRNFLRHEVIPVLLKRWPALLQTLGRDARQQAEAAELLDILAEQDYADCRGGNGCLSLTGLVRLDENRQRNLVRFWLRQQGVSVPHRRKLNEILQIMLCAGEDRQPRVDWPGGEVRRYRDELYASVAPQEAVDWQQQWDLQGPLMLPAGLGRLSLRQSQDGLDLSSLQSGPVQVSFRRGGESCQPAGRGQHHSLKKLFQEAAVPPWQRERTPLVYVGDELAQIMGVCVCEPFKAKKGKPAVDIIWHQDVPTA